MKEILVPVNLRADYENLLAYAKSVAIRTDARITFFYAGTRRLLKGATTYEQPESLASFYRRIKQGQMRQLIQQLFEEMEHARINFRFHYYLGNSLRGIKRECRTTHYDLLILGTQYTEGWRGYVEGALASKLIGEVNTPVFVVPTRTDFSQIEHITYAIDLAHYDPNIIHQVKSIAGIFDARLTIIHVNMNEETGKEQYLDSLEKTISDTIDYPKVYYKFFDHKDIFTGIQNFVQQNNANMVAMTNRKKFSWRGFFSSNSLTRKMTQNLSVPVLAFSKHTV